MAIRLATILAVQGLPHRNNLELSRDLLLYVRKDRTDADESDRLFNHINLDDYACIGVASDVYGAIVTAKLEEEGLRVWAGFTKEGAPIWHLGTHEEFEERYWSLVREVM